MKPVIVFTRDGEDGIVIEGGTINVIFSRPHKDERPIDATDPRLKAHHIVSLWESELENANRHSFTDMPSQILSVLKTHKLSEALTVVLLHDMFLATVEDL
jgi:hypothetical protein